MQVELTPTLIRRLLRSINRLARREEAVLIRRFGLMGQKPETLDAVGQGLGLTKERIRQIEARAVRRLTQLWMEPEADAMTTEDLLDAPVQSLRWSVRTGSILNNLDLNTVGDLVKLSESDLLKARNFGRRSLCEVRDTLGNIGLELKEDRYYG